MNIDWTPAEERANTLIQQLREQIVTQPNYYQQPWEAQPFISVQSLITKTKLYQILKLMPKGAILHLHSDSMGDYALLLRLAAKLNDPDRFYVNQDSTGDPHEYFKLGDSGTGYRPLSDILSDQQLWTTVLTNLTLSVDHMTNCSNMWLLFAPIFARVTTLLSVESIAYQYYLNSFQYLVHEDHVSHVELRTPWRTENQSIEGTKENIILRALNQVNVHGAHLSMKIIFIDSRHTSCDPVIRDPVIRDHISYVAHAMANHDPYVVGYDLVGEEDTGQTTHKIIPLINDCLLKQDGQVYPRFYLHNGETMLPASHRSIDDRQGTNQIPAQSGTNDNLIDTYQINTIDQIKVGRVGHAIGLYKNYQLLTKYREAGIAVELCPISNQLLRYMVDLRAHPGQLYISSGLPCSLSPDDPAIFGYQGVTYDFWEACVAWNLNLKTLKLLAYQSIQYSALNDTEKQTKLAQWLEQWYQFITYISKCGTF